KKIVDDLEKYNITRAKTFIFSVPENIPKERRSDFLLGYLDGDGWVGQDGKNAGICSVQKNVLETFLSWTEEIGVHGYIVPDKREERKTTLYYLHWSKVKEIPILYHYLYDNLNRDDLFLARKKVRFERNSYLK
ncbi:MAG: LAGLIDADG family homing endonuclease, partial [Segatella copri]